MSYTNPADNIDFGAGSNQNLPDIQSCAKFLLSVQSIFLVKVKAALGPTFPNIAIGKYNGERVTGIDNTKTDLSRFLTDGGTIILENTLEVTGTWPGQVGEGLLIVDSTGKISSSHSTPSAGQCSLYQLGLCVTWCIAMKDTTETIHYLISVPRSGQ